MGLLMVAVSEIALTNINRYYGFIDIAKEISLAAPSLHFHTTESLLSSQGLIQSHSYNHIENYFGHFYEDSLKGKKMQILVAKIDMTEIKSGLVDLSSPNLHSKEYSDDEIQDILIANDKALQYLLNPFTLSMTTSEFKDQLDGIFQLIVSNNHVEAIYQLNDFLNLNEKSIDEVVLFSKILNLICMSQGFYALSYQLKISDNFMRLIELILITNYKKEGVQNIIKMADRFSSLYVGNLALRVFNDKTLTLVEGAFSSKEKK